MKVSILKISGKKEVINRLELALLRPTRLSTANKNLPKYLTKDNILMPGRTVTRTYHFNWIFIVKQVLGDYFKLDEMVDKDRQITKYAYFDSKTTTLTALGKAMNNYKLGCKHK